MCEFCLCCLDVGCLIQIKTQADINDFIPEGSYVRDFLAAQDKYFDSVGDQVYIFITEDFEYEKSENWPKLRSLFGEFTDASYAPKSVGSPDWLDVPL